MKTKNLSLAIGVAAIVGVAVWYLRQEGGHDAKGASAVQPPTVVNTVAALRQDVPIVQQSNGTVTPLSTVDLHPQTTSMIRLVHIKEGQFVKAGDLMFTLDDRSDRANVDKAQAQAARDQAQLADLERQYKRSEELVAQKFIAQSALDTAKSQVDAARALLHADMAAAQSARVGAGYNTIRAPMAGRVGAINVYPGSLVQLATSLTTITQLDPISVAFTLPESGLADLLAAQRQGAVAVEAQAGNNKPVTGKLSFIDNTVDPQAGTIRVKAEFSNRDTALWPGQYVSTRVTVQTLKGAIVVPQTAIISNTRGTFVYTMEPDQTAKARPIVRLYSFGLMAAVSGLTGSERVITEGKQNLRPGAKVHQADPASAASLELGQAAKVSAP